MIIEKIIGFRIFNKKSPKSIIEKSINYSIIDFFERRNNVQVNETVTLKRTKLVEEEIQIPESILERMKAVDDSLAKEGIGKFYASSTRPHRKQKGFHSSFKNIKYAVELKPEQFIIDYNILKQFYEARKIKSIISKQNLNVRLTSTSGLVLWFNDMKDIAKIKLSLSDIKFSNIVDVSDIGKIEEDLEKLFEGDK